MTPPLVLDASVLADRGDPSGRALAAGLLEEPSFCAAVIRLRDGAMERWPDARRTGQGAAAGEAVRCWLLGQGPRPPDPPPFAPPRRSWLRLPRPAGGLRLLPHGAVVLRPGLAGWDASGWQGWLRRHPGSRVIALLDAPLALDWPDYAAASDAALLPHRLDAVARLARAIVVPDATAKTALERCLPASAPVPRVIEPPSVIDSDEPLAFERALADVPYFIAIDRIEARANTALLLQIWRGLTASGSPVPKLVLAGERGPQVEEVRPLLQWNDSLRAAVAEAPALSGPALRHLAAHARAVLAPAFAGGAGALLRDLARLQVPVIASAIPAHAEASDKAIFLNPIDGLGWRDVIQAASREPPAPRPDTPSRRNGYLTQVRHLAASL